MRRVKITLAATGLFATTALFAANPVHAADPIKIGITTILSGPFSDRGQSEQYGAQLALDRINKPAACSGVPWKHTMPTTRASRPSAIAGRKAAGRAGARAGHHRRALHAGHPRDHADIAGREDSAGDRHLCRPGLRRRVRRRRRRLRVQDDPSELDIARGLMRCLAAKGVKSHRDRRGRRRISGSERGGLREGGAGHGIRALEDVVKPRARSCRVGADRAAADGFPGADRRSCGQGAPDQLVHHAVRAVRRRVFPRLRGIWLEGPGDRPHRSRRPHRTPSPRHSATPAGWRG